MYFDRWFSLIEIDAGKVCRTLAKNQTSEQVLIQAQKPFGFLTYSPDFTSVCVPLQQQILKYIHVII